MTYKLIALDIDDTLLDSRGGLPDRVKQAVHAAREKGVEIVIATGRMYSSMRLIVEEKMDMQGLACICFGGGQIRREDELLYSNCLPSDIAMELLDTAYNEGICAICYVWDSYVYELENEYSQEYGLRMAARGVHIPGLRDFRRIETPKLLMIDAPERLTELAGTLSDRYRDRLQVARSHANLLEFNSPQSTKGAALSHYAALRGLSAGECIAVGDSPIDRSMLAWAGLGVAMGNAPQDLKEAADIVAPGCDEEGVAWVIDEYILKQG